MDPFIQKIDENINSGNVCVVNFSATWCGPCKQIAPKVIDLAKKYPTVNFFKVDVDDQSDFADKYKIRSMPTFLVFSDGKLSGRVEGASISRLESALKSAVGSQETAGTVQMSGK